MLRPRLAVLPILLGLLAGCAAPDSQTRVAPTIVHNEVELPANNSDFYEVNLRMNRSASLEYSWSAAGGVHVYFDVHTHRGSDVQYLDQGHFDERKNTVESPVTGTVSLLWANDNDHPVRVTLELRGDFGVESVHEPRAR